MKPSIDWALDMAVRVRDFNWSHPWSNASYIGANDRLAERIARAETIARHLEEVSHADSIAELDAVTGEIIGLVYQLDALNRFRFRGDPESRAAWLNVRTIAAPPAGDQVQPAA